MKVIRSSHNQFFEPTANKMESLAVLMLSIETEVVACVNKYIAIWRDTGRIVKPHPSKEDTVALPFSATLNQIIASHCSGMARSLIAKIEKAKRTPEAKRKRYQWEILRKTDFSINEINVNLNLDNRVAWIEDGTGSHDYMIAVRFPKSDIGRSKFYVPIHKTKHMRDLERRGFVLKRSAIRLNNDGSIALLYEKEVTAKSGDASVGIDLGRNKAITRSDGHASERLGHLLDKIDRKERGSVAYERTKEELRHAVNRAAKSAIDWGSIDALYMEQLKGMKTGNAWGNKSHHWRVGLLRNRILGWADEHGVRVKQVNPAYTSQICSGCGHCDKKNRSSERFLCLQCGLEIDADINAAININQRGASVSLLRKQQNQGIIGTVSGPDLMGTAIAYHRDCVETPDRRIPTEAEGVALHALAVRLAESNATEAEALQTIVYNVGKEQGYADRLREWFVVIYETVLGGSEGPRLGNFIEIYGVMEFSELLMELSCNRRNIENAG